MELDHAFKLKKNYNEKTFSGKIEGLNFEEKEKIIDDMLKAVASMKREYFRWQYCNKKTFK